jgi:hypothetical protein
MLNKYNTIQYNTIHLVLVRTDISEEHIASILRVKTESPLGSQWRHISWWTGRKPLGMVSPQWLVNYISMVTDTTVEIPLQEALFPVCHEVHPCCKPKGLRLIHPDDGGDMFPWNIGSYKNYVASSYTIRQHSSKYVWRMASSGMLCRVALVITDVSEEFSASFIRVAQCTDSCHPDEGGAKFLRNVGYHKSHTA